MFIQHVDATSLPLPPGSPWEGHDQAHMSPFEQEHSHRIGAIPQVLCLPMSSPYGAFASPYGYDAFHAYRSLDGKYARPRRVLSPRRAPPRRALSPARARALSPARMSPQDRAYGRSGVTGRRIVPMPALLSRSPAISPVRGRPRERSLSPVARAVPERSAPHPSGRNSPRQTSPSRALSGPANHMSQFWVSPTPDEGVDRRISPGKQRTMSPAARSLGIVSRSNSPLRAVPEDKIAEPTPFSNHAVRVLHSPRRAVRTAPTAEDPGRMISQITGTTDSDEFRSGANTLERADEAMEAMAELLEENKRLREILLQRGVARDPSLQPGKTDDASASTESPRARGATKVLESRVLGPKSLMVAYGEGKLTGLGISNPHEILGPFGYQLHGLTSEKSEGQLSIQPPGNLDEFVQDEPASAPEQPSTYTQPFAIQKQRLSPTGASNVSAPNQPVPQVLHQRVLAPESVARAYRSGALGQFEKEAASERVRVGLGIAVVRDDQAHVRISRIVEGYAAHKSQQIRLDDIVEAIDDSLASDVDLTTVRRLLVGLQGTKCALRIRRHGIVFTVHLIREKPDVPDDMCDNMTLAGMRTWLQHPEGLVSRSGSDASITRSEPDFMFSAVVEKYNSAQALQRQTPDSSASSTNYNSWAGDTSQKNVLMNDQIKSDRSSKAHSLRESLSAKDWIFHPDILSETNSRERDKVVMSDSRSSASSTSTVTATQPLPFDQGPPTIMGSFTLPLAKDLLTGHRTELPRMSMVERAFASVAEEHEDGGVLTSFMVSGESSPPLAFQQSMDASRKSDDTEDSLRYTRGSRGESSPIHW